MNDITLRTNFEPSGMITGVTVVDAPPEARIALELIRKAVYGVTVDFDLLTIAGQVVYQVVGWDASHAALVGRLVEDRRSGSAI